MQDLNIVIIQMELIWENPEQNRRCFSEKIDAITEKVDLIVLPEMFTSGFTMNPKNIAETMDGNTVAWLQKIAKKRDVAIMGSLVVREEGNYYNRLVFVFPSGEIKHYDKRHTFTLAGEDKIYTAGSKKLIVDYKGWKICPLICYDLRFPVWARNTENYDLLIYVANWPKVRITAWETLLKARAIENMCYCIGVNRIGLDANGYEYSGNSAVYDSLGEKISNIKANEMGIETLILDKVTLYKTRKKLHFLNDKDNFNLKM